MPHHFFKLTGSALLAALCFGCAAPKPQTTYEKTVFHVDVGGKLLFYQESTPINPLLPQYAAGTRAFLNLGTPDPMQKMIGGAVVDALVKFTEALNFDAVKATAYSAKQNPHFSTPEKPVYDLKFFSLTGEKPESSLLLDAVPEKNLPFTDLDKLPQGTILATGSHFQAGKLYEGIKKTALSLNFPQAKIAVNMLELQAQQFLGCPLADFLASISGEQVFVFSGKNTQDGALWPQFALFLPDAKGVLAKIAVEQFGFQKTSDNSAKLALPHTPFGWLIEARFGDGRFAVATCPDGFNPAQKLMDDPNFRSYMAGFQKEGISFCVLDFSPSQVVGLLQAVNGEKPGFPPEFLGLCGDFKCYGIGTRETDGFAWNGRANFAPSSSNAQLTVSVIAIQAGMLLPALNQARERARRIRCISNEKQLSLTLIMYASDHQEKFPAVSGDAAFQTLIDQKYLQPGKVFVCPGAESEDFGYFYCANGFSSNSKATLPLIIEKPGHHKNYVNVAFLDGHCESLALPQEYTAPKQILDFLLRRGDITEEEAASLRKNLE